MSPEFIPFKHTSNLHLTTHYNLLNFNCRLLSHDEETNIYKIYFEFEASHIEDHLLVSKKFTNIRKYVENKINLLMRNLIKRLY